MSTQSLFRGTSCKALSSVAGFLSKTSASNQCRITWESERVNQAAPLPPDRLLYLKTRSTSPTDVMKTLSAEISCNFEVQKKGVSIYPSRTLEDSKSLLRELLLNLTRIKPRSGIERNSAGLNLMGTIVPERIIVEYGSPNIAKPLHMGHLRSSVTGHYVAQICKHAGNDVTSMCFLGDWGTQFGILQAALAKWIESDSVEESVKKLNIRSLLTYYIRGAAEKEGNQEFTLKAKEYSSLLERSDPTSLRIWSDIRQKTVDHLTAAWSQFGINFDIIQGESEFAINSEYTGKVLAVLKENGVLTSDPDGCIYGLVPSTLKAGTTAKVPLVKSDGSSLYLLRDIAAALHRSDNLRFDRMIYVVDKNQFQHFSNVFHLLGNFNYVIQGHPAVTSSGSPLPRKLQHVSFGKVEGMSSRGGTFVLLSDAVATGSEFMTASRKSSPNTRWEGGDETSLQMTLSALIVYCLKTKRNRDFTFNWADAIKPLGDTGTKLQYTHARLKSLEDKQGFDPEVIQDPTKFLNLVDLDYILSDPVAMDLTLHLLNFEDSFWASYNELEPCILLTYLFKLCDKTSKALKELPVKTESDQGVADTRLTLFALSRQILGIGMNIIGIKPLDRI